MPLFSLVQLLTPIFCLLMIGRLVSRWRRRQMTLLSALFWLIIWLGIGVVSFFLPLIDQLPAVIGIQSGVNTLIYFGMVVLFSALGWLNSRVDELERKLSRVNQELALREGGEGMKNEV